MHGLLTKCLLSVKTVLKKMVIQGLYKIAETHEKHVYLSKV